MQSFWNTLPRPFFVLAPMADVTDPAFRRLIAETAKPDVMWTEFVSADGLYHTREPRKREKTGQKTTKGTYIKKWSSDDHFCFRRRGARRVQGL